jgi:putative phage-type endonuclease
MGDTPTCNDKRMKSIIKPEHGSLEWLQTRHKHDGKTIVGASEVSAVMGVNPYKNIIDLAIEKLQPPVVREQNQAMKRGTYLEQGLLDYASAEIGSLIVTPAMMYLNDRIISTLDGVTNDSTRLFEAKTTTGWIQGDECLPEWFWQAQAQMHCTDATTVTFIVLDRQLRISMFDVIRDDEAIADMVAKVELFCTAIDEERLPEDVPLSADQVGQLHPTPSAGEIELGAAGLDLVQRWQAAKEMLKTWEEEEASLKDALANLMRNHDAGTIDGHKVITYKAQSTTRFDQKALLEAQPDLAKQYQKQSSFRVMRVVKGAI